jgi:archaellum component FlaC
MLNSPLREEPRNQRAAVIPLKQESSLLDWLQSSNRLIAREVQEADFSSGEDDVEALMGVEDGGIDYDIDDDDDVPVEDD